MPRKKQTGQAWDKHARSRTLKGVVDDVRKLKELTEQIHNFLNTLLDKQISSSVFRIEIVDRTTDKVLAVAAVDSYDEAIFIRMQVAQQEGRPATDYAMRIAGPVMPDFLGFVDPKKLPGSWSVMAWGNRDADKAGSPVKFEDRLTAAEKEADAEDIKRWYGDGG